MFQARLPDSAEVTLVLRFAKQVWFTTNFVHENIILEKKSLSSTIIKIYLAQRQRFQHFKDFYFSKTLVFIFFRFAIVCFTVMHEKFQNHK